MTNNKEIIDKFVRDVTTLMPRPKSEVRRRLNELISSEISKARREVVEEVEEILVEENQCKWNDAEHCSCLPRAIGDIQSLITKKK